jgi:uncharacterized sulfatase
MIPPVAYIVRMPDKPNILFITSDQHRWDALGAYGITPVRTPNLDRLAERWLLVDRAYCTNPLCSPSRLSMITSQYSSRHGVNTLGVYPDDDYPDTMGACLGRAGYATGLIGKAHFRPCAEPNSIEAPPNVFKKGFWRRWNGPYYGFDHVELCIGHSHEHIACAMHYGLWLDEQGCDTARYWGRDDQGYCDIGHWDLPEQYHNSRWVAERTMSFIDRAADAGKPFFAFASFQDPHNPVVAPDPWYGMYDRSAMPDYTYREGEMQGKPPFYQEFIDTARYHNGTVKAYGLDGYPCVGRQLTSGEQDRVDHPGMERKEHRQEAVAVYYGMISLMDQQIGRIVDHLEARGLAQNTLIVFTSDHGEYLGNHGLWWKGLPAYEDAQRVPFIACWPAGIGQAGRRVSALHSLVDLAPTFLAAAGLAVPDRYQGVSQLDVWQGKQQATRDWAMVEFKPNDGPFYQKTLITPEHKLVVYMGQPYGELYDLAADPDQMHNLWADPEHAELKTHLLQRLIDAEMGNERPRRPRLGFA